MFKKYITSLVFLATAHINFSAASQVDNKEHVKSIIESDPKVEMNLEELAVRIISISQKNYPNISSEYEIDKIHNIAENIKNKFPKEYKKYSEIYDYFENLILNFLDKREIYDMIGIPYPEVVHKDHPIGHMLMMYFYPVFSLSQKTDLLQNVIEERFTSFDESKNSKTPLYIPQHCVGVSDSDIPHVTDNIMNCVGLYIYQESIRKHALGHYDTYCQLNDIERLFREDFNTDDLLKITLLTTKFSSHLQNIYGYLRGLGRNIKLSIFVPHREFHSLGDTPTNDIPCGPSFFLSERIYDKLDLTCYEGKIYVGKTSDTKETGNVTPYPIIEDKSSSYRYAEKMVTNDYLRNRGVDPSDSCRGSLIYVYPENIGYDPENEYTIYNI